MEWKFPLRNFRTFGYNSPRCPLSGPENAAPFATVNFKLEFLNEWKATKPTNHTTRVSHFQVWFELVLNLAVFLQNEAESLKKWLCYKIHMAV